MDWNRWREFFDWADDDGLSLQGLPILAFLLVIVILVFGPCEPPVKKNEAQPLLAAATYVPSQCTAGEAVQTEKLYFAPAPTSTSTPKPTATATTTPVATVTVTPVPTPPGGGFRQIAFSSNRYDGRYYHLYMMDANGQNVEQLTSGMAFDRDPHFSYTGRFVAFCSDREEGIYQLYILDLVTRSVTQVTYGKNDKTNPIWSPDDRQILFTMHQGAQQQLGLINREGGSIIQLTATYGQNHAYSFSHDGRLVAFESSVNGRQEVFIMELATRQTDLLIRSGELTNHSDPVFNPMGRTLIFTSDCYTPRIRQIFEYDIAMKTVKRLTRDTIDRDDPVYSPDGRLIAYIALWENAWNIFVMDRDGGNVRNLTQNYFDNSVPTWR